MIYAKAGISEKDASKRKHRVFSYFMHEDEVLLDRLSISRKLASLFFAKFFIPPFFFLFSIIFISEFNIEISLFSFLFFANIRVTWNEKKKGKNGRDGGRPKYIYVYRNNREGRSGGKRNRR